jgi:trk system potassium uptake protein TrkH
MKPTLFGSREDMAIVLRDLGRLMPIVGAMALVSLFVPFTYGESFAVMPLIVTAGASMVCGAVLYFPFRRAGEPQLRHAMFTAALGWLLVPALGSLPFLLTALFAPVTAASAIGLAPFRDPACAFFESLSGYTTTGLSMATRPDLLPHTLQWWRSFTQWVGAMGIIVVVLAILGGSRPGATLYSLYYAETRAEKILPTIRSTLRTMWWIFFLFTGVSILALWRTGTPIWQAANHAMTALSTAGFSLTPPGTPVYANTAGMVILMMTMLAGAISFTVHYDVLGNGWGRLWRDYQTRSLFAFVVVGTVFLTLENLSGLGAVVALRESAFHFVSAATTTGLQNVDLGTWSETAKLILACGMFVGGAAGSTAGGVKIIRLVVLLKGAQWRLRQILSPRKAIIPFRIGQTVIGRDQVGQRLEDAALIMFLSLAFVGVGVMVLLHTAPSQFTLGDVVLEAASAQANAGLSTGITSPDLPLAGKLVLCLNMWVGRLEIIPVLLLIRSFFARGR